MCFIHRTHYSARRLSGTFQKCWLLSYTKVGWRKRGGGRHFWEVTVRVGSACALSPGRPVTSDWSTLEPEACLFGVMWINLLSTGVRLLVVIIFIAIMAALTVWWSLIELALSLLCHLSHLCCSTFPLRAALHSSHIAEIWPLLLTIQPNSQQSVYVYPRLPANQQRNNYHWYFRYSSCQ